MSENTGLSKFGGGGGDKDSALGYLGVFHVDTEDRPVVVEELVRLNVMYHESREGNADAIIAGVLSLYENNKTHRPSLFQIAELLYFWIVQNDTPTGINQIMWLNSELTKAVLMGLTPEYGMEGKPNELGALVCKIIRGGCQWVPVVESMVAADVVGWLMDVCETKGMDNNYLTKIVTALEAICSKSSEAHAQLRTHENDDTLRLLGSTHHPGLYMAVYSLRKCRITHMIAGENAAAAVGGK